MGRRLSERLELAAGREAERIDACVAELTECLVVASLSCLLEVRAARSCWLSRACWEPAGTHLAHLLPFSPRCTTYRTLQPRRQLRRRRGTTLWWCH